MCLNSYFKLFSYDRNSLSYHLFLLLCYIGEEDSHMYQTVGHDAIEAVAKALDLPLYRRPIRGVAKEKSLEYLQTDGDEVEDLYCLLEEVKVIMLYKLLQNVPQNFVKSGFIIMDFQKI